MSYYRWRRHRSLCESCYYFTVLWVVSSPVDKHFKKASFIPTNEIQGPQSLFPSFFAMYSTNRYLPVADNRTSSGPQGERSTINLLSCWHFNLFLLSFLSIHSQTRSYSSDCLNDGQFHKITIPAPLPCDHNAVLCIDHRCADGREKKNVVSRSELSVIRYRFRTLLTLEFNIEGLLADCNFNNFFDNSFEELFQKIF